ncbi:MAG: hypothetical protein C0404_06145 [Verrucomicrobia bacterium]|nr:hypothetical protein [Verrucomicrobiota bacterium]
MRNIRRAVPVCLDRIDDSNFQQYMDNLQAMGADGVFFAAPDGMVNRLPTQDDFLKLRFKLRSITVLFREKGIEPVFWMGRTIGHVDHPADYPKSPFQPIVGPRGKEAYDCFCPLDAGFRKYLCDGLAIMAGAGVNLVLLDDDYRMMGHGDAAQFGCYCPLHLAAFKEKTGLALTPEEVFQKTMCGMPGTLRDQWLDVQGQSLYQLSEEIERAVSKANPEARVGLCSVMWHSSGHDGVELPELARKLAGKKRPFVRTIGAPYWAREPFHVIWVTEFTRLQQAWLGKAIPDVELLAEGDTYPHTRFHTSATMLNSYMEFLSIAGFPGFLCYAMGYTGRPNHEKGYVELLAKSRVRHETLRDFAPASYIAAGVRPLECMNSMRHWVMPEKMGDAMKTWPNQPVSLKFLGRLGIPLAYEGDSHPVFLCGYGAAGLSDAELNAAFKNGAVLDAVAADWLAGRGFDVGVKQIMPAGGSCAELFEKNEFNGTAGGFSQPTRAVGPKTFFNCTPQSSAKVISRFVDEAGKTVFAGTVLHENAKKQRFCILPFGLHDLTPDRGTATLMFDYARQEQLVRCLGWVGRRPLPVAILGLPDIHLLCRVSPKGDRMVIAVQNAHLDTLVNPVLILGASAKVGKTIELLLPGADKPARSKDFTCVKQGGHLLLTLNCEIPPMGLVALRV